MLTLARFMGGGPVPPGFVNVDQIGARLPGEMAVFYRVWIGREFFGRIVDWTDYDDGENFRLFVVERVDGDAWEEVGSAASREDAIRVAVGGPYRLEAAPSRPTR